MSWTAFDIEIWLRNCADRMTAAAPELNALDGQLGDGDLGATLQKCAEFMRLGLSGAASLPTDAFKTAATACARASGSSFGTLLAVAFMVLAKETADKRVLLMEDVAPLLEKVTAALMVRGRSKLGDKTALDSLEAIRLALTNLEDPKDLQRLCSAASERAIEDFRMRQNMIGRARMFAEKSVGLADPGMVAVARIVGRPA
ncbi:MAG: DAK2 domain-containing protein [Pseudomonadota bacterium]